MRSNAIVPGIALALGLCAPAFSAQPSLPETQDTLSLTCKKLDRQLRSDFAAYRAARTSMSSVSNGSIDGRSTGSIGAAAYVAVGIRITRRGGGQNRKSSARGEVTALSEFRQKQRQTLAAMKQAGC